MSAIFRAEIASLQRLVANHLAMQALDTNERERTRTSRKTNREADRQAVADVLKNATRSMTSTEIGNIAGVPPRRTDYILKTMIDDKTATRRKCAIRRKDGEGFRNNFKYRASNAALRRPRTDASQSNGD